MKLCLRPRGWSLAIIQDSGGTTTAKRVACEIKWLSDLFWTGEIQLSRQAICEMKKAVPFRWEKSLVAIVILLLGSLAHVFALGTAPIKAAPITLAWNSANDPAIQGYAIYYGLTNQLTTNRFNVGTNLTVTLYDLLANTGYWLYAVAYDATGLESFPSNQLLLTPSLLSRVRIAPLALGGFRLTLRAAPGSVCRVEYADPPNNSTWLSLAVATADASGDLAVIDSTFPQQPSRLYRAAWISNPLPLAEPQIP